MMTTDFYSISVSSNKLDLFKSRVIDYFNLTGEIEVIISARDKDQIIIAMYVLYTTFRCTLILYNPFVHFILFCISFTVLILYGQLDSMKIFLIAYTSAA